MITIEDLRKDKEYLEIRRVLNSPNIFNSLKNADYEIRHSNFIAWLLNSKGNHGKQDVFLKKFLSSVGLDRYSNQDFRVEREKWNIDILLISPTIVIAIENKTKSKDTEKQLERYREKIKREFPSVEKFHCYWTLTGEAPQDTEEAKKWGSYSYGRFVEDFKFILEPNSSDKVSIYLDDYITALKIRHFEYVEKAKIIVQKYRGEISDIFNDLDNINEECDAVAIKYLRDNSSFVRGIGFFSSNKQWLELFARASGDSGFYVYRKKTTQASKYFSFVLERQHNKYAEKICFGFFFIFEDKKNVLQLRFGLIPENIGNKKNRDLILSKRERYRSDQWGYVKEKNGKHISIAMKEIVLNPLLIEPKQAENEVKKIFKSYVIPFVTGVSEITDEVLCDQ
jgi:hypothetical protein